MLEAPAVHAPAGAPRNLIQLGENVAEKAWPPVRCGHHGGRARNRPSPMPTVSKLSSCVF